MDQRPAPERETASDRPLRGGAEPANAAAPGPGERADESRARWAFLAEASRCLADSIDYETTLETVAGLALPHLGAWSIVDLTEANGSVRRLAIVHPDPAKQEIARALKSGWPPRRDDPVGIAAVLESGRSEMVTDVTDALLVAVARSDENLSRLRALGMRSVVTVPIEARQRVLGAISFIASAEGRRFTAADLSLAEELAARCGLAIDNARMHRAARVVADAERARIRAEAADQVKTEFLRTVSHELRTPLNVMAGYIELLAMELAGPLTPQQRLYVERVQAGEEQLLRIVEDMLNFVRLYTKEIEYSPADIAVHRVVTDVTETYRKGLEDKSIRLVVECDPRVRAFADPAKVWQILMNLLSNARKFTGPGGVVRLECLPGAETPAIRVTDSGCGIPAGKLEAVFEPFVQAEGGLSRPAEGMGLGLAISRHLARDMGGDLSVTSPAGEGCTFVLTLAPALP
jgi:signal transduction histidine kinase